METILPRLLLTLLLLGLVTPVWGKPKGYRKATEGQAVVLRKLFPKKKRIEVNANLGGILNQSFVDTVILHGGISYHFSEEWGLALEGAMAINTDRAERTCIESFYNDFRGKDATSLIGKCYTPPLGDKGKFSLDKHHGKLNIGPAYMSITEIDKLFSISAVWSPIYGKQIFSFLPRTSHMDIFLSMGGGMAMATFYGLRKNLRNEKQARYLQTVDDPGKIDTLMESHGAKVDQTDQWGEKGRPEPEQQTKPFISLGVGQKYHFLKRIFIKVELRNFTLLATSQGYHNFFSMWGGLGVRL